MKKVLILGAGLVAKPIIRDLLEKGYYLTVTDVTDEQPKKLTSNHPNANPIAWQVDDVETLDRLIAEHDITVSLIPWIFHPIVARAAVRQKKNMITASYVKPEMAALDADAKSAGIIILNECGLDPGIDHMSAMRVIDHIHHKGGKVQEFYSLCGALPAPECNDNLFGYKFSWSPKGVVLASSSSARYLKHGKTIEIPTENLFKDRFSIFDFPTVGEMEVYPNRDSMDYVQIYGIPEAETVYRGTLRFPHWCEIMDVIKACNLITQEQFDFTGKSYADMVAMMLGTDSHNIKQKVAAQTNVAVDAPAIRGMEWLGLFSEAKMNRTQDSPFEVIAELMIQKMPLGHNERDMNVMLHIFRAVYPDGTQEIIKSKLLDFGSPATETSIARNVTLPVSVAVQLILNGKINLTGVYRPTIPQLYNPILDGLEAYGIKMEETFNLPLSEMIP